MIKEYNPDTERRQITVMFCDLVDSTKLSQELDPEDFHQIISKYQSFAEKIVNDLDGHIAQYLGDGILVYFGYPAAHEDDARRAVEAAFNIIERLSSLSFSKYKIRENLKVRIGIHTGDVVIGEIGSSLRRENLALGNVPNISALLQKNAKPNEIIVSTTTCKLVDGFFNVKKIEGLNLDGEIDMYRILERIHRSSRFELNILKGLTTPFVGREKEIDLINRIWDQVKNGIKKTILVEGSAGIGKSRIVFEFRSSLPTNSFKFLECQCWDIKSSSPFSPIYEGLKKLLDIEDNYNDHKVYESLQNSLESYGLDIKDYISIFGPCFSADFYESLNVPKATPEKVRLDIIVKVCELLEKISKRTPLIFFIEDIHWSDPSTLELLDKLVQMKCESQLLIFLTYRPEFIHNWEQIQDCISIHLKSLNDRETREMIRILITRKFLNDHTTDQIIDKSDGIPLFIEEIIKVFESIPFDSMDHENTLSETFNIPSSLSDFLMSRLDSLGKAKIVAQAGSIIGREFSFDLINTILDMDKKVLEKYLDILDDAEITFELSSNEYIFKHALIQDAAYNSITRKERVLYHKIVASYFERKLQDGQEVNLEVLANHLEKAELFEKSINYWLHAAKNALEHSANLESDNYIQRALRLLLNLNNKELRNQLEINLMTTLVPTRMALEGFVGPKIKQTIERAMELYRESDKGGEIFPLLVGLSWYYHLVGNFKNNHETLKTMFELSNKTKDYDKFIWTYSMSCCTNYMEGNIEDCYKDIEIGLDYLNENSDINSYGYYDPTTTLLCYKSLNLWAQGYPDQAVNVIKQCQTNSYNLEDPFNKIWANYFAALTHQHRLDYESTKVCSNEFMTDAKDQAMPYFALVGKMLYCWSLSRERIDIDKILPEYIESLILLRQIGVKAVIPYFDILLGEIYYKVNEIDKGLELINQTLKNVTDTNQKLLLPDVLRVKGDLLLVMDTDTSKNCYIDAIEISKEIGSISYELRSANRLSEILIKENKQDKASDILKPLYNKFTEGFETGDLKNAKNLLRIISL